MNLIKTDVRTATHVQYQDQILEIKEKWGVDDKGLLQPPSKGGFGVITTDGRRINMMMASAYFKDDGK
jgi:hypothetical protein